MDIKGIRAGVYRHYKGAEVEVIGSALHSETLQEMVIYRHLTGEHGGETHFWVRPREMFLEEVAAGGARMPRFEYLGPLAGDPKAAA